jgi:hypothetical protein
MTSRRPSVAGLKNTSAPVKSRMSRTARGIIKGLTAAAAHARGEIALPVRYVEVPAAVDVRAIRGRSRLVCDALARGAASKQFRQGGRKTGERAVHPRRPAAMMS